MDDYFEQFFSPESDDFSVVIENDGKVCYTYLLKQEQITADVWLFNNGETPVTVDWQDRTALPFKNPLEYIAGWPMLIISNDSDVDVKWLYDDNQVFNRVGIFIDGRLAAVMKEHSTPGWSINAGIDNPLARALTKETDFEEPSNIPRFPPHIK